MYKIPFRQNGTCTRFARQTEIRWMAWHRGVHNFNIASLPVFNCLVLYWRRVSLNLRPRQLRLQFDQWVLAKTVRWSVAPLPFLLFDCGVRMSDSLAGERDHCTVDGVSRPLPVSYVFTDWNSFAKPVSCTDWIHATYQQYKVCVLEPPFHAIHTAFRLCERA